MTLKFFLAMLACLVLMALVIVLISPSRWSALADYAINALGTILVVLVFASVMVGITTVVAAALSKK